jgi:hypothetical protein
MQQLREAGHTVTVDWPSLTTGDDSSLTPERASIAAEEDLRGIERAELLWLIMPEKPSIGCFVELGYALARLRQEDLFGILVSGSWRRTIFAQTADVSRFARHEHALEYIRAFY